MASTADLYDERGEALASCETQFRSFGGRGEFSGVVTTIRCANDNGLVKRVLTTTDGHGRVLVVDGGGSLASALMGDLIAAAAVRNGWEGVVIHGPVRGSRLPADRPTSSKGRLMPQAIAYSAVPPSTTSRVWLM